MSYIIYVYPKAKSFAPYKYYIIQRGILVNIQIYPTCINHVLFIDIYTRKNIFISALDAFVKNT